MNMSAIVCTDKNGAIGYRNKMIFDGVRRKDMIRFKELTMGNTVVMGFNTFDSLPFDDGLPGRKNIVISGKHTNEIIVKGIETYDSIESFLEKYKDSDETIYVMGGSKIYDELLPYCDKIYLTYIDKFAPNVDRWFNYNEDEWEESNIEYVQESNMFDYYFIDLKRIKEGENKNE